MTMLNLDVVEYGSEEHLRHQKERISRLWAALHDANELLSAYVEGRYRGVIQYDRDKVDLFDRVLWDDPSNMPPEQKKKRKEAREIADKYKAKQGWLSPYERKLNGLDRKRSDGA